MAISVHEGLAIGIFSRVLRDYTPLCQLVSVGQSVGWLVGPLFTFPAFLSFFEHTAPA